MTFVSGNTNASYIRNEELDFDYFINSKLSKDFITFERIMVKKSGYKNTLMYNIHDDGSFEALRASRTLAADLLSTLKTSDNNEFKIITMDIETYVDTSTGAFEPYLIGYYKDSEKKTLKYNIFHINDGKDFIEKCFDSLVTKSNNGHVVYFHNLGGFDVNFILTILYKKYGKGLKVMQRKNNILGINISHNGVNIYIRDSLLILPSSLDALGKSFRAKTKKGELPYTFITEKTINFVGKIPVEYGNYPEPFDVKMESIDYIQKDLFLLFEVISTFTKSISDEYSVTIKRNYSISGIAYKI